MSCLLLMASLFLVSCKKSFKDGVGLYSTKQYHTYEVLSAGDTVKLADAHIGILAENNNYITWNNVTFRFNDSAKSVMNYVYDTSVNGSTQTLYSLQYQLKTDKVSVISYPTYANNKITRIWTSY